MNIDFGLEKKKRVVKTQQSKPANEVHGRKASGVRPSVVALYFYFKLLICRERNDRAREQLVVKLATPFPPGSYSDALFCMSDTAVAMQ